MDILCVLKAIGIGVPALAGLIGIVFIAGYNDQCDDVRNRRLHRVLTVASSALRVSLVVGLVVLICLVLGMFVLDVAGNPC